MTHGRHQHVGEAGVSPLVSPFPFLGLGPSDLLFSSFPLWTARTASMRVGVRPVTPPCMGLVGSKATHERHQRADGRGSLSTGLPCPSPSASEGTARATLHNPYLSSNFQFCGRFINKPRVSPGPRCLVYGPWATSKCGGGGGSLSSTPGAELVLIWTPKRAQKATQKPPSWSSSYGTCRRFFYKAPSQDATDAIVSKAIDDKEKAATNLHTEPPWESLRVSGGLRDASWMVLRVSGRLRRASGQGLGRVGRS